jgi:hypothetical protein
LGDTHSAIWIVVTTGLIAGAIVLGLRLGPPPGARAADSRDQADLQGGFNWQYPLVNGMKTDDLADASKALAFSPVAPDDLGKPTAIWVTDPESAAVDDRVLALVYIDPTYGEYWVLESHTTATKVASTLVANCTGENGCEADKVALVTLESGDEASVQRQETTVQNARWVHNSVMYTVMGPATTMSWDAVLVIANSVAQDTTAIGGV